jgi:hypothetical protein
VKESEESDDLITQLQTNMLNTFRLTKVTTNMNLVQ